MSSTPPKLPYATQTLLELANTREVNPRSTIAAPPLQDVRSARALASMGKGEGALDIGDPIGQGGMSVVRRGRQLALGREVAVKMLREDDPNEMLRLVREAWITGALEHPNVVPVHDIALGDDGKPLIILKRIAGAPWSEVMGDAAALRDRFGARDPLEWNVRILMQVCNAVHFAHSRGILHRDLKSDNVMIGEFGEVYVLDWGLAVALVDDGTGRLPIVSEVDTVAGTPVYMAPEMLEGKGEYLSIKTDVYLLGAILHEVVTGQPPHHAATLMEILESAARSKPTLPDAVPAELADIVRRALARKPEDRFETAEALRLALASFLEHRASAALAEDAAAKLDDLEAACAAGSESDGGSGPDADHAGARGLYDLFGVCRFGFQQALRTWPENPVAKEGLRRAVVTVVERELREKNPRSAEMVLEELVDPPEDLARRVREARKRRDQEEQRLEALDRDLDPRIGRRVRLAISAFLGVMWTFVPWLGWYVEHADPKADQKAPLLSSTLMLILVALVAHRARRALWRTALNRALVRGVGVVLASQIVLFAVTLYLGVSYEHTRVMVLCLYAACASVFAATVEQRLWPTACGYLAAVVLSACWPALAWPIESVANLVLTVNVWVMWRDSDARRAPPAS